MFLKQHSVLDVIGGIALSGIMYVGVYAVNWEKIFTKDVATVDNVKNEVQI